MSEPSTLTPSQVLRVEDLEREELLSLIQESGFIRLSQRDLWRARWEVLERRAKACRGAVIAALDAYEAAPKGERREAAWREYESLSFKRTRAERRADRAYAVLDATRH